MIYINVVGAVFLTMLLQQCVFCVPVKVDTHTVLSSKFVQSEAKTQRKQNSAAERDVNDGFPTTCIFGQQLPIGSKLEQKLIKISFDGIETRFGKGATPPNKAIACDRGDLWVVEYVAERHKIPGISHVTIDKKTMEIMQVFLNQ